MPTAPCLRPRRLVSSDEGVSLVEAVIAIAILGFTLTALAAALIQSLGGITRSEDEVRATQIRNQVIEGLRARSWDAAGICVNDPNYEATIAGNATVAIQTGECTSDTPKRMQTIVSGGVAYSVTTDIVWDAAMATKQLAVNVAWPTGDVTAESTRAARDAELDHGSCDLEIVQQLVTPDPGLLDEFGVPLTPVRVSLTTCGLSITDTLQVGYNVYGVDGSATATTTALTSLDGQVWTATLVGATFCNGNVDFAMVATRISDGAIASATESASFDGAPCNVDGTLVVVPPVPTDPPLVPVDDDDEPVIVVSTVGVDVVSLVVAPSVICTDAANKQSTDLTLQIIVTGDPDSVQIEYTHGLDGGGRGVARATLTAGTIWSATIPSGSHLFGTGKTYVFTAIASRSDGSNDALTAAPVAALACLT